MDEEMKNAILELIKDKLDVSVSVDVGTTGYVAVEVNLKIAGEDVPFAWDRDSNHVEVSNGDYL